MNPRHTATAELMATARTNSPPAPEGQRPDLLVWLPTLPALLVTVTISLIGYALLHNRLHTHYLDDAWSVSFAWTWMQDGVAADRIYRDGGALTFGYSHFSLYGHLLELFGWTKGNALLISTGLMTLAAACWFGISRAASWPRERAALLALSLLLFYKCVESANLARPDALVLCLLSLSLLCLARGRPFCAGLVAMMAVETHPIGATVFFYHGAWLLADRRLLRDRSRLLRGSLWLIAGIGAGAACIYLSRPELFTVERLQGMPTGAGHVHGPPRSEWTWLDRHFRYHSHVELAVFVAALLIYLGRRLWRSDPLPLLALGGVLLAAALIRRPNGFYVLMAFPAFALLSVRAFSELRLLRLAFAILLLSFAIRAGLHYQQTRNYDFPATMAQVTQMVPQDDLPVVGLDDFWFGLRERRFVPANYAGSLPDLNLTRFYLVDSTIKPGGLKRIRKRLGDRYSMQPVAEFTDAGGQRVTVHRCALR